MTRTRRFSVKVKTLGFTLVELLVVVAVVGTLAAVSYPSYLAHVQKTKRTAVAGYMLSLANQEEQYLLDAHTYFCTSGCTSENIKTLSLPSEIVGSYAIEIATSASPAPAYTITATRAGNQTADTKCGDLTLDSTGVKGTSVTPSPVSGCW